MDHGVTSRMKVVAGGMRIEREVISAAMYFKMMNQRRGQALMNALSVKAPELYEIISGTLTDCFYDDSKIPDTLAELGFNRGFYDE